MKVRCLYVTVGDSGDLCAHSTVIEPRVNDPLVLGDFNRFNYYLLGCLQWWFRKEEYLLETLSELTQLESADVDLVEVCQNDSFLEITLDGAQSSNLSDDSVTDQPEGRFTYQEVKTIFLKYKEFLEMPVSLDSALEFEL